MTGLRERHKADRTKRILQAASRLFRAHGYAHVRIEDIAAAADVSAGTCYNYFATKGDILLAIVAMEVEEVIEAGRAVVADPPRDVGEAVDRLTHIYYDHSLEYLSKEMWRAAMALSIEAPDTPNGRRYSALDRRLSAQVTELIRTLQGRGLVRADLDADLVGELLFNNLNQMFTDFVKDEGMTLRHLKARVGAQTRPIAVLIAAG